MTTTTPNEFWHTRHACGHSAYWSNPAAAFNTSSYPCLWCGAQNGKPVPANELMVKDGKLGLFVFRDKLPDGTVPWPKGTHDPGPIRLNHRADGSCCAR